MKWLYEAVRGKVLNFGPTIGLDYPPWQCSSSQDFVKQFLAQKSITETEKPFSSPDLAPNGFWLFPKIKSALKGRRFLDIEDIQKL
jgi:hypothetical protein